MNKYLYLLVSWVVFAIILGLYFNTRSNYDVNPVLAELKRERLEVKIIEKAREDTNSQSIIRALSWEDFKKLALGIAKEYDIPPSVMIAQAALESSRGQSYRAKNCFNFFGLAAYSRNAPGLCFSSAKDGLKYYAKMISSGRYKLAYDLRKNPYLMIEKIYEAGYAEDPSYVGKVVSMPEFHEFL